MTTDAHIHANGLIGLAGPGPSGPEGSGNAARHGLSAGFRVLTNENRQEFDGLIAEYHRAFAPTTTHERFLVEEMVSPAGGPPAFAASRRSWLSRWSALPAPPMPTPSAPCSAMPRPPSGPAVAP